MRYRKDFRKRRGFRDKTKTDDVKVKDFPAAPSSDATENPVTTRSHDPIIQSKMQDVRFASFTAMGFDQAVNSTAQPYPLFGKLNSMTDANYVRIPNDLAGNTVQYNNSTDSMFAKWFDTMAMKLRVRYRYIPNKIDSIYIKTLARAFDEVSSAARLEPYNELEIFSNKKLGFIADGYGHSSPTDNQAEALVAYLNSYQANLQNYALIPAMFNRLRSLFDYMTTMCYQRGDLNVSALGKLLFKKTVTDVFDNMNIMLQRSYFDIPWFKMISGLTLNSSRKADEILAPYMEIIAAHKVPNAKLMFDTDTLISEIRPDSENIAIPKGDDQSKTINVTLETLEDLIYELLSPYNVIKWARRLYNNQTAGIPATPEAYVNYLTTLVYIYNKEQINSITPNQYIQDLITVSSNIGVTNWQKGVSFQFDGRTQIKVNYNKVIEDIYRLSHSGPYKLKFFEDTMDWRFYTLWNRRNSVPTFDLYKGGLTIASSLRDLTNITHGFDNPMPQLFIDPTGDGDYLFTSNRDGYEVPIKRYKMSITEVMESPILKRLNPLYDTDRLMDVRIPTVLLNKANDYNVQVGDTYSAILTSVLQKVFGYGQTITSKTDKISSTNIDKLKDPNQLDDIRNVFIDPDLFSIIQVRTNSFAANVINDIRRNGFFKVPVTDEKPVFGLYSD